MKMDSPSNGLAEYELIRTGILVHFESTKTHIEDSALGDERLVRIELQLGELEEDEGERSADHEWGALGFIYCLAMFSFEDARPRGGSGVDFSKGDALSAADLLMGLRFEAGALSFSADYIRGRCLKTDITVRADGSATLATRCRGEAATRWVAKLEGKRVLKAAP